METLFLPLCIVAIVTTLYARSAFRRGDLRNARSASLVCIAACSVVAAAQATQFIRGGNAFDVVIAVVWAWLAYMEIRKLDLYNKPPPGPGEDQNKEQ